MSEHSVEYTFAKNFLDGVRRTQDGAFWGIGIPTAKQEAAIDNFIESMSLNIVFNGASDREATKKLLVGFEELCENNNITYPEKWREEISSILIGELFANAHAAGEESLDKLVIETLNYGTYYLDRHHEPS